MAHIVSTLEVSEKLLAALGLSDSNGIRSVNINFSAGSTVLITIEKHATDLEVGGVLSIIDEYKLVKNDDELV
jgi:hypothetical protein